MNNTKKEITGEMDNSRKTTGESAMAPGHTILQRRSNRMNSFENLYRREIYLQGNALIQDTQCATNNEDLIMHGINYNF